MDKTDRLGNLLWRFLGAGSLPKESKRKLGVVALLYFIQGSPPAILWEVLPVYFRVHGVSLRDIGGLRLLELPYSLKFFWSPLVHRYGDQRLWITACLIAVATVVAILPFAGFGHIGGLILLILIFTVLSATQDVAIDAYTVGLTNREEEGPVNGVRASAYRVALVLLGGGMILLAQELPWRALFLGAAVVFLCLSLLPPFAPKLRLHENARQQWLSGFVKWIGTWKAVPLVLFVLTYKLGEFAIGPMIKPFWVDQGRSLLEIGLIPTSFGIVLSVAGALAGGAFLTRYGIFHAVWGLGLLQAVSNLGYAFVAWLGWGRYGLYAASVFESFSGGLGTAAFLAFLMNICQREQATVQYAFLSSVFSLTGRLIGGVSGWGAERMGYGGYFAFTFLLALPAYLLLPWVRGWIHEAERKQ